MRKDWAVKITVEHEFDTDEDVTGVAVVEMKVSQVVEGDDEACDALWAAREAKQTIRDRFKLPRKSRLHVLALEIRECD